MPENKNCKLGYTDTAVLDDSGNEVKGRDPAARLALRVDSTAACARSLAGLAELSLPESVNHGSSSVAGASPVALSRLRGLSDSLALQEAHHDKAMHQRFRPQGDLQAALFSAIEQERYEAIGANRYPGVRLNLDAREPVMPIESFSEQACLSCTPEQIEALTALLCREAFRQGEFASTEMPPNLAYLAGLVQPDMQLLVEQLEDQQAFAATVLRMVARIARHLEADQAQRFDSSTTEECAEEALAEEAEPDELGAEIDELGGESEPAQQREDTQDELAQEGEAQQDATDRLPEQALDEAPTTGPDPLIMSGLEAQSYHPYTTEFDEIVQASSAADAQSLAQWRTQLDEHIALQGRLVSRLAQRLQRVLLARQNRRWQYDQETGLLDSHRLPRIIADPLVPLSFKTESDMPFRSTTITLLIDNSRSMLGRPILIAAACADILARTLERCGVSVEILGFTTVHLHGGRSTELWQQQGKPENPGRLNDLRHIVYKSADVPYRRARRNLGLMLDRDILKQNIDGESLQWAFNRLLRRTEQRRILIMLSDGAPVDTSTLSANSGDYLASHLRAVISRIERSGQVELMAIGIGHDVGRYYSKAVSVFDARQLGPVLLEQLDALFSSRCD